MFIADAAQGHEAGPGTQANQVSQKCVAKFRIFIRVGSYGNRFNIEINISQHNIHLTFINPLANVYERDRDLILFN